MDEPLTLKAILEDERLRAHEFPVTRRYTYLAHAAVSPLPRCTSAAMARYLRRACREGQFERLHRTIEAECRQRLATLLACESDEIAFVPSTSAGLSMVATGLDWRPGDSVVIAEGDFPSNVYPWRALNARGVRLRLIPKRATGEVTLEDVCAAVDASTRLVALSSVHYVTGAAVDLRAIGDYLHRIGVLLCVDAIQGVGAIDAAWREADFLVADGHKWLLAPQGLGVLVVRAHVVDRLRPVLVGWKTVDAQDYRLSDRLMPGARRYEPGSLNAIGLVGLHASLGALLQIGLDAVYTRITALRRYAKSRLAEAGCHLHGCSGSGIVAFSVPLRSSRSVVEHLAERGILVSARRSPDDLDIVRIAPHLYNSECDLDRLATTLSD